jgi:hypothetical protein
VTREPTVDPVSDDRLPRVESLDDLERLVRDRRSAYVRYSPGPERDSREQSIDTESGLQLPGLSVNPLRPELWWTRPMTDWLARQICQYEHLRQKNPDRYAWILDGRIVGRGPDNEPLLAGIHPLGRLSERVLDEARQRYRERFDAGKEPED